MLISNGRVKYRVLGPLEIFRDDRLCTPSAPKQRALLALLLLNANELLPASRIIDELWSHRPPRSADAALQMYVCGVRRVLCPDYGTARQDPRRHPILRTEPSGYMLCVNPDDLDLIQFHALAAGGRASLRYGSCAEAGSQFRKALALWRGAALADLSRSGMLSHYAMRLEEERLTLWQERVAADICQRRSGEVIGELEEFCARYPLREKCYEQLMLALCSCDRRAEALNVYGRARDIMIEHIGIEPGPGLRAAQQAILDGRSPLNGGHEGHARRGLHKSVPRRQPRRRRK